ncbi:hypothetical protein D915_001071 [Fasciola hepatica]|uniref:UHRF1-binding protein 1-like n=1 Tax=Fasciola hepatica TaxID=6192 RepID=A0A4E0RXC6_FASHE|nr:hypothetical protein D915_001071 [Fasciola hepatica]
MRHPPADPLLNLPMQMPTRFSPFPSTVNLSVIQSVLVLRIRDFDVSRVSFPDTCKSGLKSSGSSAACNALQYRGEELPSATHLFLASDKKLHCLPESSNVITVELRTTYRSRERKFNRVADNLIFIHLGVSCPLSFSQIILPIPDTRLSQTGISSVEAIQSGPDALVIQFDQVVIQLLAPPLNQTAASVLKRLLAKHALISVTDEFATDRGRVEARTHVPVNLDRLSDLGASAGCSESIDTENQYWCVHCPHMWAQFLTVVKVLDDFPKKRNALGRTNLSLYRQSMLEPIPLTLWASLRFPFHPVPAVPVQPGFQLLIDLDCPVNPLDTDRRGFASLSNQAEPISLFLGAVPPVNGKLCWLPIGNQRLPDALDQLLFLCNLANQLSRVKDQLGLDMNRISGVLNNATEVPSARTSPLLYTLAFVIQKRLQLHLVSPGGALSHMNRTLRPPVDDLDSSNFCSDQQQSPVPGQLIRTAERLDRDHPESHSSIMERMSPPAKAHMDVPINLKHKNNSFIALVDNNRQTDNFSLKSSSTSDITSVSDDYMDKEAGAQENWLSTYEVLFRTEDALRDSDSTSVSSSGCCSSNHRFDYPKPSPEEVGTELFEMESLRLSQHTSTSDSDPLKSASGRSSRLSQSSFGDRNQREATCCPESPNENPYPLTIMLMLDGVAGEADGTDTKMRMWLKIGLVSLAYKHGTPDCMIHEKTVSELPDFPSTSRVFSWSIFTSVIRQLVNKSPDDPNETDEPSYRTSVCLHADLLKSCSLQIPKVALQTGEQLLRCFNTRGGLDRLQSMLPTGTLLREMQAPLTTMDVSLHLKRGFLAVEMGSLQTSEPGELIRKIHLQQGLSLVLDKNAVLNVGLSENNSRVVHPKKMATDSSEILVDAPYLAGDNNDLLCQYLQENAQLEKNMRQLNSTVDELKTVLASMDHLLSMIPQR